jgi:hypothetical protein
MNDKEFFNMNKTLIGRGLEAGVRTTPVAGTSVGLVAALDLIKGLFELESVALAEDLETWLIRVITFILLVLSPVAINWGRRCLGIETRKG